MTKKQPSEEAAGVPPTALAGLVDLAKERMKGGADRHAGLAVRALAAIVRDLKGLPGVVVAREGPAKLRIGRRGKIGYFVVAYERKILAIELTVGGFSDANAGSSKVDHYTLQGETWALLDHETDLFADLREHLMRLYPELG